MYYWGRSRQGTVIPKVKTSGQRLRSKLKKVALWAEKVRNRDPLKLIWSRFCTKMEGHIRYYGVSFNFKALRVFQYQATRRLFKHLNRRSQRQSFTWEQLRKFVNAYPLPKLRICQALF